MTLSEAIIHCEEVADRCAVTDGDLKYEMEHRQLAEWLKELKRRRAEQRWIPCSERLPEKEVVYIITVHYDDRNFITFDNFCSYKHGWKEWSNQEVLAWMPLPKPYAERK